MTTVLLAGGGSGGHLMPALAVADATRAMHPDWRMVFAGAERGVEAQVLPARGVPHHLLPFQPIYRRQWWKNARWPLMLPGLIARIDRLLDDELPSVVIGTGGYVSGPVLYRAARRGLPTGILELDVRAGLTTRLLAPRVREIWLAAPEAMAMLPRRAQDRASVTGAPIVPPDPGRRAQAQGRLGVEPGKPVLVITGGSQGSLAVNRVVAQWIRGGGSSALQVIWATGRATHAEFAPLHHPPAVQVLPFIDPMADAWSVADVCIARAGMMTLSELCAWGLPSLLIPLPTAAADHQTLNARAMADAGAAILVSQQGLDGAGLARALEPLLNDPARRQAIAVAARSRARPDAAAVIASRVTRLAATGAA